MCAVVEHTAKLKTLQTLQTHIFAAPATTGNDPLTKSYTILRHLDGTDVNEVAQIAACEVWDQQRPGEDIHRMFHRIRESVRV